MPARPQRRGLSSEVNIASIGAGIVVRSFFYIAVVIFYLLNKDTAAVSWRRKRITNSIIARYSQ